MSHPGPTLRRGPVIVQAVEDLAAAVHAAPSPVVRRVYGTKRPAPDASPAFASPVLSSGGRRTAKSRRSFAASDTPHMPHLAAASIPATPVDQLELAMFRLRHDPGFLHVESSEEYQRLSAVVRSDTITLACADLKHPERRTYIHEGLRLRHDFWMAWLLFPGDPVRQQLFTALCQGFSNLKYSRVLMCVESVHGNWLEVHERWHAWKPAPKPKEPRKRPRCWAYSSMVPGHYIHEAPPLLLLAPGITVMHLTDYNAMALLCMAPEFYGTLGYMDDVNGINPFEPGSADWVRRKARFPFFGDSEGRITMPTDEVVTAAQVLRRPGIHTERNTQRPILPYWSGNAKSLDDFNRTRRPQDGAALPLVLGPVLCHSRNVSVVKLCFKQAHGRKDRINLFRDPREYLENCRVMYAHIQAETEAKLKRAALRGAKANPTHRRTAGKETAALDNARACAETDNKSEAHPFYLASSLSELFFNGVNHNDQVKTEPRDDNDEEDHMAQQEAMWVMAGEHGGSFRRELP